MTSFTSDICLSFAFLQCSIAFRGCADATRQAHMLIATLIKDPDVDIMGMLPKPTKAGTTLAQWEKPVTAVSTFFN